MRNTIIRCSQNDLISKFTPIVLAYELQRLSQNASQHTLLGLGGSKWLSSAAPAKRHSRLLVVQATLARLRDCLSPAVGPARHREQLIQMFGRPMTRNANSKRLKKGGQLTWNTEIGSDHTSILTLAWQGKRAHRAHHQSSPAFHYAPSARGVSRRLA